MPLKAHAGPSEQSLSCSSETWPGQIHRCWSLNPIRTDSQAFISSQTAAKKRGKERRKTSLWYFYNSVLYWYLTLLLRHLADELIIYINISFYFNLKSSLGPFPVSSPHHLLITVSCMIMCEHLEILYNTINMPTAVKMSVLNKWIESNSIRKRKKRPCIPGYWLNPVVVDEKHLYFRLFRWKGWRSVAVLATCMYLILSWVLLNTSSLQQLV